MHLFLAKLLNIEDLNTSIDPTKQFETHRIRILDAPQGNLASAIYKCFKKPVETMTYAKRDIPLPARFYLNNFKLKKNIKLQNFIENNIF